MVKVEIEEYEARALSALMKDAKTPIQMGFILESFRRKMLGAFSKKQQDQILDEAERILSEKKKKKGE